MHELTPAITQAHFSALKVALDAGLGPTLFEGMTAQIDASQVAFGIRIHMTDAAQAADDLVATNTANAHDPVFLSADKTEIQANGTDVATITVRAPKAGAAAVTLSVSNGTASNDWGPISLTGGVGTDTFAATDPGVYIITVKNPNNRSTDQIVIVAR